MRIGYACIPLGVKNRTNRGFMIKNFNNNIFYKATEENLEDLYEILKYNLNNRITMFRISSDIIPFGSHEINNLKWWEKYKGSLDKIGKFVVGNDMRISMHPGQYTILNSPKSEVVDRAIKDIEYHCRFLDSLNVDYSNKIVIHGGGVYGNKDEAMERFIENFQRISDSAKKRIVLENDERCFNIEDILYMAKSVEVPVIFDNLHHACNNTSKYDIKGILKEVDKTWGGIHGKIKVHYSDQDKNKKLGSHSLFVDTNNFINYVNEIEGFDVDVMLETKDKDISAIKLTNVLFGEKKKDDLKNIWGNYKYAVMERGYNYYKDCSKIVNSGVTPKEFFLIIDSILYNVGSGGSFINASEHVWGYVSESVTEREKKHFIKLKESGNGAKVKEYLNKLCDKYGNEYIKKSYFFIY